MKVYLASSDFIYSEGIVSSVSEHKLFSSKEKAEEYCINKMHENMKRLNEQYCSYKEFSYIFEYPIVFGCAMVDTRTYDEAHWEVEEMEVEE